jgi:hypothetical protein
MLAGFALAVGFGFTLIPPAVKQGQELVHNAPRLVRATRESRAFRSLDARYHLAERVQALEQQLPEKIQRSATPILNAVGGALSAVGAAITIVFLVVFIADLRRAGLIKAAVAEARPERRPIYADVLAKIYQSTGGYLGGLSLICLINATLTTIFLAIDGVPFFLPLGLLSGLSSLVPYAGPFVAGTVISLIRALHRGDMARDRGRHLLHRVRPDRREHPRAAHLPANGPRQPAGRDAVDPVPRRDRRHHRRDRRGPGGGDAAGDPPRAAAPAAPATRPRGRAPKEP